MQIMLKSSDDKILENFKPEIVFLDNVYLAEEESAVNAFSDLYGLTKDDIKNAGLKIMKNKITLPAGTSATILDCKNSEITLRVKDIEFDCIISYNADFAFVDIEAIDAEKEKFFSQYPAQKVPSADDKTLLYGYYVCDLINAINTIFDYNDRRIAYEELKYLPKERAEALVQRFYTQNINQALEKYGIYAEIVGPFTSEDNELYTDKAFFKKLVSGKSKVSPYRFYVNADHSDEYNDFVNYCKDLPGLYFYRGMLATINEAALKRFIAPYEKQTGKKIVYEKRNIERVSTPLYVVINVYDETE